MESKQALAHKVSGSEFSYFDLQAYVGTTKHMGGLETTQELVELCHIGQGTVVLDVDCGVGATACYLARQHGCRVVGVDLHSESIWAQGGTSRTACSIIWATGYSLGGNGTHYDHT